MARPSSAAPPKTISRIPPPGATIAEKYRVVRVLGGGGMGAVLVAHHQLLDQQVAIKVLSPEFAKSPAAQERFFREARAAARLKSEHVGRVMDVGVDGNRPFIVMELLDGCDLEQLLQLEGPMEPENVADYVLQTLEAMAQAHGAGIVHRDLKPANLFLALRPDGTSIIKVLDFGISKEEGGTKRLTGPQALGSPEYMSPEQVRSAASVDSRTDIWSLGVVMYELLTGEPPFHADGPGEIFAAILGEDPPPLREKRPDVPEAFAAMVHRCLERDKDRRFADVGELARAVAPFATARWSSLVESIVQTLARANGENEPPSGARIRRPTPLAAIVPQPAPTQSADVAPPAPVVDLPPAGASPEDEVSTSRRRALTVLSAVRKAELEAKRRSRWRWAFVGVLALGAVVAGGAYARKHFPLHRALQQRAPTAAPVAVAPEPSASAPVDPSPSASATSVDPAPVASLDVPPAASASASPRKKPGHPSKAGAAASPRSARQGMSPAATGTPTQPKAFEPAGL
jgi:eukaryotic-like serine/threonine-protein kinase